MQSYRPQVMDDGSMTVTILHRRSPTQYCSSQFEFSGKPVGQQYLQVAGGDTSRTVYLRMNAEGRIAVAGAGVQQRPARSSKREEIGSEEIRDR